MPAAAIANPESDQLRMEVKPAETTADTSNTPAPSLQQGDTAKAKVTLHDGRSYNVSVAVAAPRPRVELVGKSVQSTAASSNIQLASDNQLPQDAQLIFSVRAKSPSIFSREANIEVASADEALSTTLSLANRTLTLADSKVAVATFDPTKAFGFSAFGPLKFRVVNKGVVGRLAAVGDIGSIAGAEGSGMPDRSRAVVQAHRRQLVPRGLGREQSRVQGIRRRARRLSRPRIAGAASEQERALFQASRRSEHRQCRGVGCR